MRGDGRGDPRGAWGGLLLGARARRAVAGRKSVPYIITLARKWGGASVVSLCEWVGGGGKGELLAANAGRTSSRFEGEEGRSTEQGERCGWMGGRGSVRRQWRAEDARGACGGSQPSRARCDLSATAPTLLFYYATVSPCDVPVRCSSPSRSARCACGVKVFF